MYQRFDEMNDRATVGDEPGRSRPPLRTPEVLLRVAALTLAR